MRLSLLSDFRPNPESSEISFFLICLKKDTSVVQGKSRNGMDTVFLELLGTLCVDVPNSKNIGQAEVNLGN